MKKVIKILFILLVSYMFVFSNCLATDANANLTSNENTNAAASTSAVANGTNANTTLTTTISTTASSLESETLNSFNVLNVLLIIVGAILILVGIAILIRMHS